MAVSYTPNFQKYQRLLTFGTGSLYHTFILPTSPEAKIKFVWKVSGGERNVDEYEIFASMC